MPDIPLNPTISTHLPDLIDSYIATRDRRLTLDREAAGIKEQEDDLKKLIISKFREGDILAQGAKNGLVKMKVSKEPVPENWELIYEYIQKNGAWELLHKRLTSTAVKEHWDHGEILPGVGSTDVYTLSVSKA